MSTHIGQVIFRDELLTFIRPLMEHVGLDPKDLHSMLVYRDRVEFDLLGVNDMTFVHVRVTDRPPEPTPITDKLVRDRDQEPTDG